MKVTNAVKRILKKVVAVLGYEIVRYRAPGSGALPSDISTDDAEILKRIAGFTMTGIDRQIALIHAVRHVVRSGVSGCFVECGVWRGGSAMAIALTLAQEGETDRHLYLFDTFEGMSPPTADDETFGGMQASDLMSSTDRTGGVWCYADLNDVRTNMQSTSYPMENVHFVKGQVESTIPSRAPADRIALLRLDTDWYESTKHELMHLFPQLGEGGILIIDDYGHWQGAKKAVDEFFTRHGKKYFLHRIDYTGRLLVKH